MSEFVHDKNNCVFCQGEGDDIERSAMSEEIKQPLNKNIRTCEDCGGCFFKQDGRPYKHEPSIWLCDGCHDERMED